MSEIVRDLYVQLSLNTGSFAQDIKGAQEQVKQAEVRFKAAGAGVKGFENTITGMQARVQMAKDKIAAQNAIVEKSTSAFEAAKKKVQDAQDRQAKYAKSVADAKAALDKEVASSGRSSEESQRLAKELEKVSGQYKATEKSIPKYAQEVEKSETAMIGAQATLKGMEVELRAAEATLRKNGTAWGQARQKVDEYAKAAEKTGKKVSDVGGKLNRNVTVPIMAVAAAGYKAWDTIDDGLDTVIRKTGATGAALVPLEKAYNNVFLGVKTTAEGAGIAVGEVNTRFKATGAELEDLSKTFIQFSDVTGADLNTSIGNTSKILAQWKQPASAAAGFLGLLTSESQRTGIGVDRLMESVQTNGATIKAMGLNLSQAVQMLANFEAAGINADTALAALKKSAAAYSKDGAPLEQGLSMTVKAIQNAKNETEALAIAQKVFGAKGALEMTTAIRENRFSVTGLTADMTKMGSVVSSTFAEINGDTPVLDKVKQKMIAAGASVGKSLLPWIEKAAGVIGNLADGFAAMDPAVRNNVVSYGLLAAAAGPVVTGIGNIITASGTIAKFITGPAGWVTLAVAAVAGLVGWISSIKSPIDQMKDKLKNIKISVDEKSKAAITASINTGIEAADKQHALQVTIDADTDSLVSKMTAAFADGKFKTTEYKDLTNAITNSVAPDVLAAKTALDTMTGEVKTKTEGLITDLQAAWDGANGLLKQIYKDKRTPTEAEIEQLNKYLEQIGVIRGELQAANVEAIAFAKESFNLTAAGFGNDQTKGPAIGYVTGTRDNAKADAYQKYQDALVSNAGNIDAQNKALAEYNETIKQIDSNAAAAFQQLADGIAKAAGAETTLATLKQDTDALVQSLSLLSGSGTGSWLDQFKAAFGEGGLLRKYLPEASVPLVDQYLSTAKVDSKYAKDYLMDLAKTMSEQLNTAITTNKDDPKINPVLTYVQTLFDNNSLDKIDLSTFTGAMEGAIDTLKIPNMFEGTGADAGTGLATGITTQTPVVVGAVNGMFQAAIDEANRMRPKLNAALGAISNSTSGNGGYYQGNYNNGTSDYNTLSRGMNYSTSANQYIENYNVNTAVDAQALLEEQAALARRTRRGYGSRG